MPVALQPPKNTGFSETVQILEELHLINPDFLGVRVFLCSLRGLIGRRAKTTRNPASRSLGRGRRRSGRGMQHDDNRRRRRWPRGRN